MDKSPFKVPARINAAEILHRFFLAIRTRGVDSSEGILLYKGIMSGR
jgi:hypothetical protein